MREPNVRPVVSGDVDGNAFTVMSAVSKALRKAGADKEYVNEYMKEAMATSYDNLLRVSMEYADFDI